MTTRRRFSDKFKATGALEALRGDRTVQEIAAKHGLHPTQVTTWKRQAITVLSLTRQCKLLKISRSSLYYRPVGFDEETLKLMNEIDRVFTKYPFFGSRQITAYLPRNGFRAGRHRARRLMTVMGLEVIYKAPNTSKKHSQHKVYPYLLRKLSITRANHVWCSDITYIPMRRGFHCLVAIMDWATCKVLSWRLSNTLDASFCIEALNEAIAKYGNPEIMNTDQGSQFTGAAWITTLGDAGYQNINGRAWQISRQYIH